MEQRQYITEQSGIVKNSILTQAREIANLTIVEAANQIGINYQLFIRYENLKNYPSKINQRKICNFYRKIGVFLLEEDVFPEELRYHKRRTYKPKNKNPEIISFSSIDEVISRDAEEEILSVFRFDDITSNLDVVLSSLSGSSRKLEEAIRLRYGISNGELKMNDTILRYKLKDGTLRYRVIGNYFDMSTEGARQRVKKAERIIQKRVLNNRVLRAYIEGI